MTQTLSQLDRGSRLQSEGEKHLTFAAPSWSSAHPYQEALSLQRCPKPHTRLPAWIQHCPQHLSTLKKLILKLCTTGSGEQRTKAAKGAGAGSGLFSHLANEQHLGGRAQLLYVNCTRQWAGGCSPWITFKFGQNEGNKSGLSVLTSSGAIGVGSYWPR